MGTQGREHRRKKENRQTQVTRRSCLTSFQLHGHLLDACAYSARQRLSQAGSRELVRPTLRSCHPNPEHLWQRNQTEFQISSLERRKELFGINTFVWIHILQNELFFFFFCQLKKYRCIQTAVGYNREISRLSKQRISIFTSQ